MGFDKNQIFYAALWWVKALPGGAKYADDICAEHGMASAEFAVDPPVGNEISPVSRDECTAFFSALRQNLQEERAQISRTRMGSQYLHLGNVPKTGGKHGFSEALEQALKAAGLDPCALPQKPGYAHLYLHDDGQAFARVRLNGQFQQEAIDYPGQLSLPYPHIDLKPEDFHHCPQVFMHTLYRILLLKEGQEVRFGWPTTDDSRYEMTAVAKEGDALAVNSMDTEDIEALSEEDILTFSSRIERSSFDSAECFTPGYESGYGNRIEATGNPGIVREISGPAFCMEVTGLVQIGCGGDYFIVRPGDRIFQGVGFNGIVRKEIIESGKIILVACDKEKDVARLPKGPQLS